MSRVGSVFLGDGRHRILSTPTPPMSPSLSPPAPTSPTSMTSVITAAQLTSPMDSESKPTQPVIKPVLSLELRLRWLEALLLGVRQDAKGGKGKEKAQGLKHGETIVRLAEDVQRRLDVVVESNEGLKRFMDHYDQHAHLLTPSFALSGTLPGPAPSYDNMTPEALEAFLTEMEPDIRAADRDMREIEVLEKKGVTGAGKLTNYESLIPRIEALMASHDEDVKLAAALERRIATLMERNATHVDALSELFVAWDDAVTDAESQVAKLERQQEERLRLGYE